MSQNPFESPQAQLDDSPYGVGGGGGGSAEFDLGTAISSGFSAVTANPVAAIVGMLVGGLAIMVSAITIIGIFVVAPVISWGMARLILNLHDGKGEIGDVFAGFQKFGPVLGSMLLLFLAFFALALPAQIIQGIGVAAESSALALLGQFVGLVVTFGVTLRLYFAAFFIVDQDMATVDALKASWACTANQKLMTVVLAIVAGLIGMAGIIALGIGILFTMPVSYAIYASAYRQMYPARG